MFKIGCSPITNIIYAGSVNKNGLWSKTKYDVTDTALGAVAQFLIQTDQSMEFEYQGKSFVLKVLEEKENE